MSTNRLFLVDTERREAIMLAKASSAEWVLWRTADEIETWLEGRDIRATCGNHESVLRLMTEHQWLEQERAWKSEEGED